VLDYRSEGFVREALLNFMALLGWNPGGDQEKMNLDFMVNNFKLEDINTANPVFDIKKLGWVNGVWIRSLAEEGKLKERLNEFYKDNDAIQSKLKGKEADVFINAAASRMRTLLDFQNLISIQRQREMTKEEKETALKIHDALIKEFGNGKWENEKFLAALKNFSKTEDVPFKLIYFLLSGKEQGIGLLELNQIYGKDFFIKNLKS
jgi:glutamyl-tRNA synthetase